MKKVFCFGELLLRFSPNLQKQWIQEHSMPVFIGGAELNVGKALSNWGMPVKYCTALPDHYLTKEIMESLQEEGIDTFLGLGRNLVVKVKLQLFLYLFVKVVFYDGVIDCNGQCHSCLLV
jgi:hypothetical protein